MKTLPSSTYLDAFANLQASPQQFGDMLTSQASTTLGALFANASGDATVETAGSGVTITLALVLNRTLATLLYQVTGTDPLTFAAVAGVLAGVALVASYLPARRAARIPPVEALRYQ